MSDWPPSPYFIPPYRKFALPADERSECQKLEEHTGDAQETENDDGEPVLVWDCCGEEEVVL